MATSKADWWTDAGGIDLKAEDIQGVNLRIGDTSRLVIIIKTAHHPPEACTFIRKFFEDFCAPNPVAVMFLAPGDSFEIKSLDFNEVEIVVQEA